MDYQLVIKFWRKSLENEAFLLTLESELANVLGDAVFDGYDTKTEAINVFVNTADPQQSFRRIKRVIEKHTTLRGVSAAFRVIGGAQFTSLWPPRAMRKFRLP
jgi:hypothetical protein